MVEEVMVVERERGKDSDTHCVVDYHNTYPSKPVSLTVFIKMAHFPVNTLQYRSNGGRGVSYTVTHNPRTVT